MMLCDMSGVLYFRVWMKYYVVGYGIWYCEILFKGLDEEIWMYGIVYFL